MKASRGKKVLLAIGVLVMLLPLAEVGLWVSGRVKDPREFTLRRMTGSVQDDDAGRYVVHDARAFTTAPDYRDSPTHAGRDATDRWPFRGRPSTSLPEPDSVPRVLVVGDSCVYGAGLDACDTLGWRLALELDALGLPPDQVAVVPLGVPGYSTEQIRLLLAEGLRQVRPSVVVLYVAAWNDQAPALRAPDREILAELAHPSFTDWLRVNTRLGAALLHASERMPAAEINAGWKAGHPPLGYRVPAEDVEPNVRGLLADCAAASAKAVVIAPPHPADTLRDHPRTAQDAASVLSAAATAGVPAIDAQELLAAAGGDPARWFLDYVHPSPEAVRLLAAAVAGHVAPVISAVLASPEHGRVAVDPVRIVQVSPLTASAMGDVPLRLKLENWDDRVAPPTVLVGGAPLLDVRSVAPDTIEGTVAANGAGPQMIVVQDGLTCSLARDGVKLVDPVVEIRPGPPARLAVQARPGDRLRLLASTSLRDVPEWSHKGALRVGAEAQAQDLACDLAGNAEVVLPSLPEGRLYVQALWAPGGDDLGQSLSARWSGVTELMAPDAAAAGPEPSAPAELPDPAAPPDGVPTPR